MKNFLLLIYFHIFDASVSPVSKIAILTLACALTESILRTYILTGNQYSHHYIRDPSYIKSFPPSYFRIGGYIWNMKPNKSKISERRIGSECVREFLVELLGLFKLNPKSPAGYQYDLGTLILVLIGCGSNAQAILSMEAKGNYFSRNVG